MAVAGQIGAAVAGSATASLLGGSGQPATQTSQKTLPSWLSQDFQDQIGMAKTYANTPFQQYTGQAVAPQNSMQTQANSILTGIQGQANPSFLNSQNAMGQVLDRAQNGPTAGQISNLENPYTQNVLNAQNLQTIQNYDLQRQALQSNATAAGAFGGSGMYMQEGLANKALGQQLSANNATGLSNAFTQGMSQYNLNTGTMGQYASGNANIASQQENLGISGANALGQAGTALQGTTQAQNTYGYNTFEQGIQYPGQQAAYLGSQLNTAGNQFSGNMATGTPAFNPMASALGGALAGSQIGNSLYNAYNNVNSIPSFQANESQNLASQYALSGAPQQYVDLSNQIANNPIGTESMSFAKGGLVKGYANAGLVTDPNTIDEESNEIKSLSNPQNINLLGSDNPIGEANQGTIPSDVSPFSGSGVLNSLAALFHAQGGVGSGLANALQPSSAPPITSPAMGNALANVLGVGTVRNGINPTRPMGISPLNSLQANRGLNGVDPSVEHANAVQQQELLTGNSNAQRPDLLNPNAPPPLNAQSAFANMANGLKPVDGDTALSQVLNGVGPSQNTTPEAVGTKGSSSADMLNDLISQTIKQRSEAMNKDGDFMSSLNTPTMAMGLALMGNSSQRFGGALNQGFGAYQQAVANKQKMADDQLKTLMELSQNQRAVENQAVENKLKAAQTDYFGARSAKTDAQVDMLGNGAQGATPSQALSNYSRLVDRAMIPWNKKLDNDDITNEEYQKHEADAEASAAKQSGWDPINGRIRQSTDAPVGPTVPVGTLNSTITADPAKALSDAKAKISTNPEMKDQIIQHLNDAGIDTSGL